MTNLFLAVLMLFSATAYAGSPRGTWDDLPVADDDVLALEQMLNAKWTHFLVEMDRYNRGRDSTNNAHMVDVMSMAFAPEFQFRAELSDGSDFGEVQGTYTPTSWIAANDVEETFGSKAHHRVLLVPNHLHVLTVLEPGKKVVLEGYHEHAFLGTDTRFATGAARQLAYEKLVFEKVDGGVWRVTDYIETLWDVSELDPPSAPGTRSTTPGNR